MYPLQSWYDYKLRWEPKEYGGVSMLHVPSDHIWRPDIVVRRIPKTLTYQHSVWMCNYNFTWLFFLLFCSFSFFFILTLHLSLRHHRLTHIHTKTHTTCNEHIVVQQVSMIHTYKISAQFNLIAFSLFFSVIVQ